MNESLFNVQCPNYDQFWQKSKNADNPKLLAVKDRLEFLWELYQPYADPNFRQEFARQVHQRFWEIYLACYLMNQGKNLTPRTERPIEGPDILIEEKGLRIWIEAVAPTPGDSKNPDQVTALHADGLVYSVPDNELLLRVTGQLSEKLKQFVQYFRAGVVMQGDLCIIAVSGGDMGGFQAFHGSGYIGNAFYPTPTKEWGKEEWTWGSTYKITKSGGEIIEASVFASPEFEHVTGAIFSSDSITSLLGSESQFQYFPNPNCSQSLPHRWIPWFTETVAMVSQSGPVMKTIGNGDEMIAVVAGPFPKIDT